MKQNWKYLLCIVCAFLITGCSVQQPPVRLELPEKVSIHFFHDTACGTCDGTEQFYEAFYEMVGPYQDEYPYEIVCHNVFQQGGRESFIALTDEYGLSRENLTFPLMIINSKVYSGMERIRDNFREAFLTAGEDIFMYQYVYFPANKAYDPPLSERYPVNKEDSAFVYFYRIGCESCEQAKPVIDALPQTVIIDGVPSTVQAIPLNTRSGNYSETIQRFFALYDVPEEDQMVPILFLRDSYLAGHESIRDNLQEALERGEGLSFQIPV